MLAVKKNAISRNGPESAAPCVAAGNSFETNIRPARTTHFEERLNTNGNFPSTGHDSIVRNRAEGG